MPKSQTDPHSRAAASRQREMNERSTLAPGLFSKFQKLIYQEAGIWLAVHKHALLTGRLARRLRLLGLANMQDYYQLVTQPDQQHERAVMIDCITTNETHFFREPRHFDYLEREVFPKWQREAAAGDRIMRLRIWSAGCSTGEEPYSLAMLLLKHFPESNGWDLEVLATDISTRVLEKARAAIYPLDKSKEIPAEHLRAYMLKGRGDHKAEMKVSPELHRVVRFARVNLHADSYPIQGSFDLIFCRNVLIYFDQESKTKVIGGIVRHLSPSGLLFVGHSEHLGGIAPGLKTVAPTIHALAASSGTISAQSRSAAATTGQSF
ncbi:MAG TPA: CheR family methyltransferase [Candidatus Binatus sp.]|jgi:chemotaxis protein methyltransferase CheR|nr:CheR family methyltransferase [Candidatus Binatus sp.]